jgi:hypothetical protein
VRNIDSPRAYTTMRLRFLAPLIVLLAACRESDNLLIGPPGVWVAAEVSPVRRDPATGDAVVPLRVLNDRRSSVYLEACGERPTVAVERRVGDALVCRSRWRVARRGPSPSPSASRGRTG